MKAILSALLMPVAAAATPLAAQRQTEPSPGSRIEEPRAVRIPEDTGRDAVDRARIAMSNFARCTLDRETAKVKVALAMPLENAWQQALNKVVAPDCLFDGVMKFRPVLLRGALFTELWRRQIKSGRTPSTAAFTPIQFDGVAAATAETRQQYGMLALADCVIRADQAAASEVVAALTASSRQAAAYAKIQPLLGPCLSQGTKVVLSKPILEGALAEVLVRTVTPPATASKAH